MSGPGEGKIRLAGAKVYIHVKGKSGATVTHIDVEHPSLNSIIKKGESTYAAGKAGGFFIGLKKQMLKRADRLVKRKQSGW
ncbi:hypothetical protein COV19_03175 [Candidatus Woesearchaeota archaeon CG10_big_fil_rev_8_21_14_0_10_44_13]|nr:MAG: hypothetical protein COV19_03175 [Candidatus Woesearchaeota archaeon CG10_big_fil_rev_8_21_14_0_10_44_13]